MKTAVVYATNSKTTMRCANQIAEKLGADVFDVSKGRRFPDISDYDAVVVGTPVRMGVLHDGAVKFMNVNKAALAQKKLAIFICNGFAENTDDYFANQFPKSLIDACVWHGSLGGELVLENLPFFDRMIMKQVAKNNGDLPEMHVDVVALDALVGAMR